MSDTKLTHDQAMAAQKALRDVLGLPAETIPVHVFIGLISDEIEKLWATGKSDNEIATIISDATGMSLTSDDIVKYYADAEKRTR